VVVKPPPITKISNPISQQPKPKLKEWNSLERISLLIVDKSEFAFNNHEFKVPDQEMVYQFHIEDDKLPSFVFWPVNKEIIYRLIMKAADTDIVKSLDL
jgi:hypothetical protein